ncbi:MAG TPA: hypothetical protein VKR27_02520 [Acidimicrobiales bacterium]|nr:hypothetical protein [Acidimicrobiales bacterium]
MPPKMRHVQRLEFSSDATSEVVAYMAELTNAGDGWINLLPKLTEDDESTTLGFFTLLGGGSTGVTMCTWIPDRSQGIARVGITHNLGRRARAHLQSLAIPIPETWRIEQDHAKRGLVLQVPAVEPLDRVLSWAIRAVGGLSPASYNTQWRAEVYLPSTAE